MIQKSHVHQFAFILRQNKNEFTFEIPARRLYWIPTRYSNFSHFLRLDVSSVPCSIFTEFNRFIAIGFVCWRMNDYQTVFIVITVWNFPSRFRLYRESWYDVQNNNNNHYYYKLLWLLLLANTCTRVHVSIYVFGLRNVRNSKSTMCLTHITLLWMENLLTMPCSIRILVR